MIRRILRQLLFEEEDQGFDDALIRTYLANERTFLAWLRSAVVFLGLGIGAIALGSAEGVSEPLAFSFGGFTIFTSMVMALWAYVSFATTTAGIEKRRYRPNRGLVAIATLLLLIGGVLVLSLLAAQLLT